MDNEKCSIDEDTLQARPSLTGEMLFRNQKEQCCQKHDHARPNKNQPLDNGSLFSPVLSEKRAHQCMSAYGYTRELGSNCIGLESMVLYGQ